MAARKTTPPIERIRARLVEEHRPDAAPGVDGPCHVCRGGTNSDGYVVVQRGRRGEGLVYAHRVVYEHHHGPIAAGLTVDHLCRVRACCNPAHLEAVTRAENVRRGHAPTIVASRERRCLRGHDVVGANALTLSSGRVRCRACYLNEPARLARAAA